MKCGRKGIDTHPEVINTACSIWYFPNDTGSGRPCKFYARCQKTIQNMIMLEDWAAMRHEEYLSGLEMKNKKG